MRAILIIHVSLILLSSVLGQNKPILKGKIKEYVAQPINLYQCYGDSLYWIDSVSTNKSGEFEITSIKPKKRNNIQQSMYKIVLQNDQFFFIVLDNEQIEMETYYTTSSMYNTLIDSLLITKSQSNKHFYQFQNLQMSLNIANQWLLQMMRLFPLQDSFHPTIEQEYLDRYKAMDDFVKTKIKSIDADNNYFKIQHMDAGTKVALAYYIPVNPDWKQPDSWRDSIIAAHYFDYFNPADKFYLHSNILPEKIDIYLNLTSNRSDNTGKPFNNEHLLLNAAKSFIEQTNENDETYRFCLNYILKRFNQEYKYTALMKLYDNYLNVPEGECGEQEQDEFSWVRRKVNILRGVQVGSTAPDFKLPDQSFLSAEQSDYVLLLFWASWCPHCMTALPEIKNIVDDFSQRLKKVGATFRVITISLDNSKVEWENAINKHDIKNWINFSEFKGWKGEISQLYNVYATPTIFLLDKEKKIIATLERTNQLKEALETELATRIVSEE